MKHKLVDDVNVNVNVELPTQDLEDLVTKIGETVTAVIVVYMATDAVRHILKQLVR